MCIVSFERAEFPYLNPTCGYGLSVCPSEQPGCLLGLGRRHALSAQACCI